jgi:20S proteasome alpha/beta subunit
LSCVPWPRLCVAMSSAQMVPMMNEAEIAAEDAEHAEIVKLAVAALNAATKRALESGQPVVLLKGCDLVRIENGVETVIKTLPPCQKVTVRTKQIRP